MKKRIISMLLVLCMLLSLLSAFGVSAAEGDLPATLSVEPSESNNIPAAIDLYKSSTSGGGGWWGGGTTTTTYHLYLPGNTDAANCFFSWEGGLKGSDGANSYDSGAMPVPAVGETKTYTFNDGTSNTSFEVTTYQGSAHVKTMFIEIDESQGTIDAMNGDPDHETECTGIIFIDGVEHELDKMKGRGNATWSQARQKRPYNITLGKKVSSILGIEMPDKTKKFSLLANVADRSLLRNKVGYDLAYAMNIGLDSESVDLWMNGKYIGLYQVMAKNDSFVSDDGYAVENDNYKEPSIEEGGDPSFDLEGLNGPANNNTGWGVSAHEYNRITVKKIGDNLLPADENGDPIETVETLTAATALIQAYMQDLWDAVRSEDGYNAKGKYYLDYIDLTSWASMYLIQEYVKGYDANAGSLLFHRDGTADTDKLFAGPLWDLDNALGSTQVNSLLGNQVDQTDANGWFMSKLSDDKTSIYKTVGQHEDFMEEVYRVYNQYSYLFDNMSANVTALAEEIADSAAMNYKKVTQETYNTVNYGRETTKSAGTEYEQVYKATNTWEDYVDNLETFTRVRSLFFKNNLTREPENAFRVNITRGTGSEITVFDTRDTTAEGKKNPQFVYALNGETGEPSLDGTCEVNFKVEVPKEYVLTGVSAAPAENFGELQDLGNGLYRLTNVKGTVALTVATEEYVCPHVFENYVCTLCGEKAFKASFACGEGSSVTVYETQDTTGSGAADAAIGYARDSDTGALDISGEGQVNFVVKAAEGYKIKSVTAEPTSNYKNLKPPAETGEENAYRVTKVKGDVTITVKTVKLGAIPNIDFTNSADADKFEILEATEGTGIEAGKGLTLTSTREAFEPCNGQISEFAPKDVVKVPVNGDWSATLKFDFDPSGAGNGYYQFFGFYAAEGEDYNNLAGIRGGDGALQNFLREDGNVTADSADLNSTPGLASAGTYWFKLEKEGTTYTCYRSADGEEFTEMFSYADTGIEADSLVIDAYTGMTEGYAFTLKSLEFEGGGMVCQHEYETVTQEPTCTEAGLETKTCAKCGKVLSEELPALGHDYEAVMTEPTCTEAGYITYTCTRCGDRYVSEGGGTKTDFDIEITCPSDYQGQKPGNTYTNVITTQYYSTTAAKNKTVRIQLPVNYTEDKRYPVLYLLHGVGGDGSSMTGNGTTIQNMIAAGLAEEMIIVYPDMFTSKTMNGFTGFNAESMRAYDNFVNDIANDLMPFMKEHYSVKEGKENTAIAGFSMGGREALAIGLQRPDLFGFVCGISPAPGLVPGKDGFMSHEGQFTEDEVKFDAEKPFIYMICSGDRDSVVGTFPQSYHELFDKNGVAHTWWIIPGSDHGDPAISSGIYNFCKNVFKVSGGAEALGHDYQDGVCTRCGEKEPGTSCAHDYKAEVTKPTCTEKGFTTYTCSKCSDTYTGDEVAALGHDFGEWKVTTAATCTAKGVETRTCSRGDKTETRDIAVLGHDYKAVVTAPTCLEAGYTTYTCAKCGDSYVDDEVAALDHDYEEEVTEPTCLEAGYTTYTCTRCKDTYTDDEVAALGHEFKEHACIRCDAKEECPAKDFTDAPAAADWAHAGIDYCVENELMKGTSETLFSPVNSLTRAQIVTILYRIAGSPKVEYKAVFTDVADEIWYTDAILWAAEKEIVKGYPDGTFAPNKAITREQIATILYREAEGYQYGVSSIAAFPDVDKVSSYAEDAMNWAVRKGLINGIETGGVSYLAPQNNATRAQFATIIMRFQELKAE